MRARWGAAAAIAILLATGCGQRPAAPRAASTPSVAAPAAATPEPTPAPTPSPTPVLSRPTHFAIPRLNISADVENVGWLGVPRDPSHVGWFQTNPAPGEQGAAVFDGHLDWTSGPAVFWHLKDVAVGDRIEVSGPEGTIAFKVDRVESVAATSVPPPWLYDLNGPPAISIITCDGTYSTRQGYDERLLVHGVGSAS